MRRRKLKINNLSHYIKILSLEPEFSKTRKTYSENIICRIRHVKQHEHPKRFIRKMMEKLLNRVINKMEGPPKYVGMTISNKYLQPPFFVPLRSLQQNTANVLANELFKLSKQSNHRLRIFKTRTIIKIQGIWPLTAKKTFKKRRASIFGAGLKNTVMSSLEKRNRGVWPIMNEDKLCLARAIVLGIVNSSYGGFKTMKQMDDFTIKKFAILLLQNAQISENKENYGLKDLKMIQRFLNKEWPNKYRLAVFKYPFCQLIYKGRKLAKNNIYLLHNGEHFDLILNIGKLLKARGTFCLECNSICYPLTHNPKCENACKLCYRYGYGFPCRRKRGKHSILCQKCNFHFPNRSCFKFHNKKGPKGGSGICDLRFYCKQCYKVVYKRGSPHKCIMNKFENKSDKMVEKCEQCGVLKLLTEEHYCYIQPLREMPKLDQIRYAFFDIESTQNKKVKLKEGIKVKKHEPNLLIAEIICKNCMDDPNIRLPCGKVDSLERAKNCCCGVFHRKWGFPEANHLPKNPRLLYFHCFDGGRENLSVAEQFLDFLLYTGDYKTTTICLAHNNGKYDLYLLLDTLYAKGIGSKMLINGLKIYSLEISGSNFRTIVFKDSLNFISGSLASFYDTFGLTDSQLEKKPNFPHLFNKMENIGRVLPHLPSLRYYSIKNMKANERTEFLKFYEKNCNQEFDLKEKLFDYCLNDVQILRESCIRFRRILLKIAPNVEPFEDCSTIAKLAFNVWRSHFLRPNLIMNLPENGLRPNHTQSIEARKFFRIYSKLSGLTIQTCDSAEGEFTWGPYRIDGFVKRPGEKDLIIEYYGCAFHGCKICFENRQTILQRGQTAEELFIRTMERKMKLESSGFEVLEFWQCKWLSFVKNNRKLRALWKKTGSADLIPSLNPRKHSLKGGRVEPFIMHTECADNEEIEHFDIISLYPSVMKNGSFPLGEPLVYVGEQLERFGFPKCPWTGKNFKLSIRGLIFCRILPPKKMPRPQNAQQAYPPFLGYRTKHGNLVFPLCGRCADLKNGQNCNHNDRKRSWIGAYNHVELEMALELGYTILDVFEIWHWPDPQWSDGSLEKDLFRSYINAMLKIKVEASGTPQGITTEEGLKQFIDEYLEKEGVQLDPQAIGELNKGLRMISKYLLNALWGKLCQRANPSRIVITRSAMEFHRLLDDPQLEILDTCHLNDQLDRVCVRQKEQFLKPPKTNNVVVASFVTAYGRIQLFKAMMEAVDKGHLLCYVDTDSVVSKRKKTQLPIEEGKFLGQMQNELPNRRILRWVSAGAKNYSYEHVAKGDLDGSSLVVVRRIRGFELNYRAGKKITFDRMLKEVRSRFGSHSESSKKCSIKYTVFRRHKEGWLYTTEMKKKYKAVYEKGIILPNLSTRPFGWTSD